MHGRLTLQIRKHRRDYQSSSHVHDPLFHPRQTQKQITRSMGLFGRRNASEYASGVSIHALVQCYVNDINYDSAQMPINPKKGAGVSCATMGEITRVSVSSFLALTPGPHLWRLRGKVTHGARPFFPPRPGGSRSSIIDQHSTAQLPRVR